jgi:ABC-type multidrug transport system fused ATPase/permease subunit
VRRYLALWTELFRLSWRRERRLTAAALAALAGSVVIVAAVGLSLRATIDATVAGRAQAAVVGAIGAAVAFALTLVLRDIADGLVVTTTDRVARRELHPRVHHDIASLEGLGHLERTDVLDRVTLVRAGTGALQRGMWTVITTVASLANLAVTLAVLGTVNPWLALLVVFAAAPVWCDHRGRSRIRDTELATADAYRLQQHLFGLAVSAGAGKEIRVALAGDEIARRQAAAWDEAMGRRFRAQLGAALWRVAGWTVFAAGFVGALALVANSASHGTGSLGNLVLTVTVAATLQQSLRSAVANTSEAAGAGRVVAPYLWLRDYVAEHRGAAGDPVPERLRDGITLTGVGLRYPGTDRPALDDITAHLPAGSVVAIVGEYGSGKTSLVKLLTKFYPPQTGTIRVDGVDLHRLDTLGWRARTSAAFQDFGRFRLRFAETVGIGDLPNVDDDDRVARAVRDADADELVAKLPSGLSTQLGRELGGVELSEGQWQRTALARASMREDPLLFVLDEPTASLDAPSEQAIFSRYMARARRLAARTGAVTVIVSHRFSTVTGADLILVLHKGRLIESGRHADLLALGGRYADLYQLHAQAYSGV